MDKQKVRRASNWWIVIGFLLPLIAILGALMSDRNDGRVSKAAAGCLIWIVVLFALVIVPALFGPSIGNIFSDVVSQLNTAS